MRSFVAVVFACVLPAISLADIKYDTETLKGTICRIGEYVRMCPGGQDCASCTGYNNRVDEAFFPNLRKLSRLPQRYQKSLVGKYNLQLDIEILENAGNPTQTTKEKITKRQQYLERYLDIELNIEPFLEKGVDRQITSPTELKYLLMSMARVEWNEEDLIVARYPMPGNWEAQKVFCSAPFRPIRAQDLQRKFYPSLDFTVSDLGTPLIDHTPPLIPLDKQEFGGTHLNDYEVWLGDHLDKGAHGGHATTMEFTHSFMQLTPKQIVSSRDPQLLSPILCAWDGDVDGRLFPSAPGLVQ